MFSEVAYKNADACRFCWMCRHLCPVSLKTGKEINSARARGLLVSMVKRGCEYDATMAENMWECVLCGACSNDCASGFEPRTFIREGRSIALAEGLAPKNVAALASTVLETGNIYGAKDLQEALKDELAGLPETAPVLLYIGEVASVETPEIAKAAMHLLKKAGVSFTVLKDEPVSGAYMGDLMGFVDEVRRQAVKLTAAIDASGAETVVVLDAMDARIVKHEYAEWNCAPKAEVLTATSYFAQLAAEGKLSIRKQSGVVSLHDAGALSRDLGETEPARALLSAMGYENSEMFRNRDLAKASGGALLKRYDARLAKMLASGRWEDLTRLGLSHMVTEAPGSFAALSLAIPAGCELSDLLVLLDKAAD